MIANFLLDLFSPAVLTIVSLAIAVYVYLQFDVRTRTTKEFAILSMMPAVLLLVFMALSNTDSSLEIILRILLTIGAIVGTFVVLCHLAETTFFLKPEQKVLQFPESPPEKPKEKSIDERIEEIIKKNRE